jgi:hypothetical protein
MPNVASLILKVQHHGSENNMDDALAERVSADHYVFCGNGRDRPADLTRYSGVVALWRYCIAR